LRAADLIRGEAISSSKEGLLRRFAPRNDTDNKNAPGRKPSKDTPSSSEAPVTSCHLPPSAVFKLTDFNFVVKKNINGF